MWNSVPIWPHFVTVVPPSEDTTETTASHSSPSRDDIFEPVPETPVRQHRHQRVLTFDLPPPYVQPAPGEPFGDLPVSPEARQVDQAYLRMTRGRDGQKIGMDEAIEYLGALGRLIAADGGAGEVRTRVGSLMSPSLVSMMSGMLQPPLELDPSGGVVVPLTQRVAIQYCELLAALVDQGLLKPTPVLRKLSDPLLASPLLLSLASVSRSLTKVSHVMCDLLTALLYASTRDDAAEDIRCRLLVLTDKRGAYGKYGSFYSRLVGDGHLGMEDMGSFVAISRLCSLELWASPVEIEMEHRSIKRAGKHDRAKRMCRLMLTSSEFQQVLQHVPPTLDEVCMKLARTIQHGSASHSPNGRARDAAESVTHV